MVASSRTLLSDYVHTYTHTHTHTYRMSKYQTIGIVRPPIHPVSLFVQGSVVLTYSSLLLNNIFKL